MTTTPIDGPTALRLLKEVVAERPDYVYEKINNNCFYVMGHKPSCVVGHVLIRAGWSPETLLPDNDLLVEHMDGLDETTAEILGAAQSVQDCGRPWREALEAAESTARRLGVIVAGSAA